ncbi:nitrate- and nitrite sensing domain-containing protein [Hydrogenophaga sp. 5NK40-0174]|uniref:nitrate- and nitrite sensing domain-containing protein n=1 Tax=Hydrogenophaga sp. 5NK40-0174 TaxID=3127649 RepID=UPI003103C495
MPSGLHFLVAAKQSEIAHLEQLAQTSALVSASAQLVHSLQRERGLSNLFLASGDDQWATALEKQTEDSVRSEARLRICLAEMVEADEPVLHRPRVLNRIALALQGLDALPFLRQDVSRKGLKPAGATVAFIRLVDALLSMVFEAADASAEPDISNCLVAMFNLMQGKELAGQERAAGAALFASGKADRNQQEHLIHLIESQERNFTVFLNFADEAVLNVWARSASLAVMPQELQRLRKALLESADGGPLSTDCSQRWFDACTDRIEAMKLVEDALASELKILCEKRIQISKNELARFELVAKAPLASPAAQEQAARHFFAQTSASTATLPANRISSDPEAGASAGGTELEKSILDMVRDQARQLQTMNEELEAARASLNERKVIERAKGLLMAHRRLTEDEAHKTMRQMAMNQNRRLIDVANAVLAMADVLPTPAPSR